MTGRQEAGELAQAALQEGIRLFEGDDILGGHAHFAEAYKRAAQHPGVLSWYGLTLVLVERNSNLGMTLIDQALRLGGPEPELILNQARAHLALGQRDRAVRAVQRGLAEQPEHPGLRAAQEELGRRQRPVLPFLRRGNPLNRLLGRMRHRSRQGGTQAKAAPAALGRLSGGGHHHGRTDG